jgi:hypothetical protein
VGRAEKGDAQGLAETLEAVAQGSQSAVGVQPFGKRLQHPLAGLLPVQGFEFLPGLGLGLADKGQRLVGEDRPLGVEGSR